jgi:predicted dienelactone hydrolase
MKTILRRVFKTLAALVLFVVVGIAALLAVLWLDHTRETTLPALTGPLAVSRATYIWRDPGHDDPMAPQPGTRRVLLAWIWYPAAPQQPSQKMDDYLPAPWRTALERQMGMLLTQFVTRDLSRVHAHSIRNAALSPRQPSYPIVFMRPGASALTADYTTLAEDLASHGYVVAGIDAPYRSMITVFPDGSVIARAPRNNPELVSGAQQVQLATKLAETWSADLSFALDQLERLNASDPSGKFTGRLDLQHVGIFGHSLGGATALEFCHDDPRCKAGIDVDGLPLGRVITDGITQPFLFLLSDHRSEPDAETRPVMADIRSIYDRLPADRRLYIVIRGAGHYRFSDGAMLQIQPLVGTLHTLGILPLDGRRQVAVTEHYISTFFDVYLKGAPLSELKAQSGYPEVEYIN